MHHLQPAAAAPAKNVSSLSCCLPLVLGGRRQPPPCVSTSTLEPIMTATLAFAAPAAGIPSRITQRLRELAAFSAPFMAGGIALHFLLAC